VYILVIQKEALIRFRSYGISCRSFTTCVEFLTLYAYGNGIYVFSFIAGIFANLYAGAFSQGNFCLLWGILLYAFLSCLNLSALRDLNV